jgi:hypothetical protein
VLGAVLLAIGAGALYLANRGDRRGEAPAEPAGIREPGTSGGPGESAKPEREHAELHVRDDLLVPVPGLADAYRFAGTLEDAEWLEPLTDPDWLPAEDPGRIRPDDPVLGLYLDGRAWALPWWIMKNHHVANLTLADRPVLVTFCDSCSSASAFDPLLDGTRHLFRIVGAYLGTILVSDDATGSLWSPFIGEAIQGELEGRRLDRLPLVQCTWQEWLALHPSTRVVDGQHENRGGHARAQYPGAEGFGKVLSQVRPDLDDRHPPHELVLGLEAGGHARAYPLALLTRLGGVVNDELGDEPLVLLHRPGTLLALAFSRRIDAETLEFEAEGPDIVDRTTGSRWSLHGECLEGPLAGRQLDYLPSGIEEWYIWAIQHPETTTLDR